MTSILYIASDERGAGKTALCASLVSLLNQRGIKAAAIKPLAGEDELADAPESRAFSPSGGEISSKSQWPLVLTSDGVTDQLLKKVTTLVK
ncbi:MAG: hypothetical protein O2854_03905, partial [Chloroflexi bacterium]|nr:hypothetical protein [Chloroflexota bacterium]